MNYVISAVYQIPGTADHVDEVIFVTKSKTRALKEVARLQIETMHHKKEEEK